VPPRARKRKIAVPRNSPNAQRRSFLSPKFGRLFFPLGEKRDDLCAGCLLSDMLRVKLCCWKSYKQYVEVRG